MKSHGDSTEFIKLKNIIAKQEQVIAEKVKALHVCQSKLEAANDKCMQMENILALMPGNVYGKSRESIYQFCNINTDKTVGLKEPEEIIGKTLYDFPDKKVADIITRHDEEIMQGGEEKTLEEEAIDAQGNSVIYLTRKMPLRNKKDQVTGLLGISFDITQLKKIEKELKFALEKAEIANKIKTKFLMNMSHDFRTPVSGIYHLTNVVNQKLTDPGLNRLQSLVVNSSAQMLSLLEEILDYSRLESDQFKLNIEKIDINALIEDVIAFVASKAEEKQLTLSADFPVKSIYYQSDRVILQRVILNLVTNAIKFTDQGSVIVTLKQSHGTTKSNRLIIEIKDTGIGIAKKYQRANFEPFFRIDEVVAQKYPGVGLGLSNVNFLIKKLGGTIKVSSKVGEGAVFMVSFPMNS